MMISDGEPTAQYSFRPALLVAAKAEGIHTGLDSCGALDWPRFFKLGRRYPELVIDVMAYHDVGAGKYDNLGRARPALG